MRQLQQYLRARTFPSIRTGFRAGSLISLIWALTDTHQDYQTYKNGWLAKFALWRCEQHTCKWDRSCARFGYKYCCPPGSGEKCGDGYRFIKAPPPDSAADDSASHAGP